MARGGVARRASRGRYASVRVHSEAAGVWEAPVTTPEAKDHVSGPEQRPVDRTSRVLVGVGGGIAAFKTCQLVREFTEHGADVTVVPTAEALKFVGAATFEALSGNPVATDVFAGVDQVRHVRLGKEADAVVIAPATADLIARIAAGRADDLLTASVLVATCPVILAPAMHTEMWLNPATQANVRTLRDRGIVVLDPASGRLTGADSGAGRMLEPGQIAALSRLVIAEGALGVNADPRPLAGRTVLITAGGTREPLDPVRFLGNRSSGRQGFALAEVAGQMGARVQLVVASSDALPVPANTTVTRITTAAELADRVAELSPEADVIIMAAAVSDYRPARVAGSKMKKGAADAELSHVELVENPDVLRETVRRRAAGEIPADTVIVGFAAETGDDTASPLDFGKAKLRHKGCDILLCNDVSQGKAFGTPDNAGWLLVRGAPAGDEGDGVGRSVSQAPDADVAVTPLPQASKHVIAHRLLAASVRLL